MSNYLLVVAHPDDEVLGAGATMYHLSKNHNIDVCIMSSDASARFLRPDDQGLDNDIQKSLEIMGVRNRYNGHFPNIQMNNEPHLNLVKFIEEAIIESQPDVVITHHPSDTNNDHLHTSLACQAAIRLFQRRKDVKPLGELWFMEVLSSTEWSVNTSLNKFSPNIFIEAGEDGVNAKLEALAAYRDVMRDYPHPRSAEAVKGLAAYRGAQAHLNYAEAFECVFRRVVF